MDTGRFKITNSMGNIAKEYAELIAQAATATGFNVSTQNNATDSLGRSLPDYIHVVTAEPARDHGPFWAAYRRLRNARDTQSGA